ncbi:YccF domain-containing protein [Blastococcus capsensis]|uniref:YccF domain-containing protein n=1 Tax=Blastococcus capsensis TaxID=1564163 RepID=UPI002540B928|nr:YccF domain-containing protein [Blastococcus capsensis]MDK3256771.1 YccF domain-containing protein [Blastococcus capsensis]
MRLLLNVVWLVLQGWVLALAYALAGVLACLLVVTIPFGIAAFRLAFFVLWPFGRTTVRAPGAGAPSVLGNLLWFLLAGWWLALLHVVAGIGFCLTIVGIPFGVASFKLAAVGLFPLGKRVVPAVPPRGWRHAGGTVVHGGARETALVR